MYFAHNTTLYSLAPHADSVGFFGYGFYLAIGNSACRGPGVRRARFRVFGDPFALKHGDDHCV